MNIYLLPDGEIISHEVSKRLNQNIKVMMKFSTMKNQGWKGYGNVMRFKKELILYSEGDLGNDVSMKTARLIKLGFFSFS